MSLFSDTLVLAKPTKNDIPQLNEYPSVVFGQVMVTTSRVIGKEIGATDSAIVTPYNAIVADGVEVLRIDKGSFFESHKLSEHTCHETCHQDETLDHPGRIFKFGNYSYGFIYPKIEGNEAILHVNDYTKGHSWYKCYYIKDVGILPVAKSSEWGSICVAPFDYVHSHIGSIEESLNLEDHIVEQIANVFGKTKTASWYKATLDQIYQRNLASHSQPYALLKAVMEMTYYHEHYNLPPSYLFKLWDAAVEAYGI